MNSKIYFFLHLFYKPFPGGTCTLLPGNDTVLSSEGQLSGSISSSADVTLADYPDEELC